MSPILWKWLSETRRREFRGGLRRQIQAKTKTAEGDLKLSYNRDRSNSFPSSVPEGIGTRPTSSGRGRRRRGFKNRTGSLVKHFGQRGLHRGCQKNDIQGQNVGVLNVVNQNWLNKWPISVGMKKNRNNKKTSKLKVCQSFKQQCANCEPASAEAQLVGLLKAAGSAGGKTSLVPGVTL